ncbi:DUF2339 domain-containing protein [Falsibacillus albus]|uniref:DUF2339 domain-containing protein n=1 Tax=Falsibacillus albus TaxID=2478915 RepID=UPI00131457CC|nr:DUF2339 domain-containing protein [Falsibacillus albus]
MDQQSFEHLEERVHQLENEVRLLKKRLDVREEEGGKEIRLAHELKGAETKRSGLPTEPIFKEKASNNNQSATSITKTETEPIDWEYAIGRVWLPRIFIFVLLLGVVWGFKVAVEYSILTETARVILGFVSAGIIMFIGEKQFKHDRSALGKVLLTGSVSILILTTFAMNSLYGMIPAAPAFIMNILWIGLGIYLSKRHRSEVMAILFAVMGYLIPFLLAGQEGPPFVGVIYEIFFYGVLLYFAIHTGYKLLFFIATGLLHFVLALFFIVTPDQYQQDILLVIAIGALMQHFLIFYSVFFKKLDTLLPIPILFTSFVLTTAWAKAGLLPETIFNGYLLMMVLVYCTIAFIANKTSRNEFMSVSLSIATFGLGLLWFQLFENDQAATMAALLLEGIAAVYLGEKFKLELQKISGYIIYIIGGLMVMVQPIDKLWSGETFVWIGFIASMYGLIEMNNRFHQEKKEMMIGLSIIAVLMHVVFLVELPVIKLGWETILWFTGLISLSGLYLWTKRYYQDQAIIHYFIIAVNTLVQLAFITLMVSSLTKGYTFNIEMMSISFSWAIYASVCLIAGVLYNNKALRLLGMGLLLLTLGKLILFDLQYVTIVIRAILFIGLGMIGIVLSRLYYVKKA